MFITVEGKELNSNHIEVVGRICPSTPRRKKEPVQYFTSILMISGSIHNVIRDTEKEVIEFRKELMEQLRWLEREQK